MLLLLRKRPSLSQELHAHPRSTCPQIQHCSVQSSSHGHALESQGSFSDHNAQTASQPRHSRVPAISIIKACWWFYMQSRWKSKSVKRQGSRSKKGCVLISASCTGHPSVLHCGMRQTRAEVSWVTPSTLLHPEENLPRRKRQAGLTRVCSIACQGEFLAIRANWACSIVSGDEMEKTRLTSAYMLIVMNLLYFLGNV